jgi:hypothetical protein
MRRKRVNRFLRSKASLIVLAILLSVQSGSVFAAGDCITEPNLKQTGAGHWYYRFDRARHRKCWYLERPDAAASDVASRATQSSSGPASEPTAPSVLSSFALTFAGTDPIPQSEPTNDDVGATAARSRTSDAPLNAQPRGSRHAKMDDASTPESQEAALLRSRSKRLGGRDGSLDAAKRDALFREFLHWQARQDTDRAHLDVAGRDALFREFLLWQESQGVTGSGGR